MTVGSLQGRDKPGQSTRHARLYHSGIFTEKTEARKREARDEAKTPPVGSRFRKRSTPTIRVSGATVYLDAHAHRTVTRTRHRSLPLLLSAHYSTAVRNQETCDDTFPTLPLYSRSPCTPFDFTVSHCWERANE